MAEASGPMGYRDMVAGTNGTVEGLADQRLSRTHLTGPAPEGHKLKPD